jgi:phosphoglycolate phosphatase-like HAD superfamily hydrolase
VASPQPECPSPPTSRPSDIDGAHAASVSVVGYANRPEKIERFVDAQADIVITSMAEVASALLELRL